MLEEERKKSKFWILNARKKRKTKGIWTLDRGGDRRKLFVPLFQRKLKFVVRMTRKRDLIDRHRKVRNIVSIAQGTRCSQKTNPSNFLENFHFSPSESLLFQFIASPQGNNAQTAS